MDAERMDLNLLRVFDALMQDGNLTRAGFRLGLSQPTMSHALSKLRKITRDRLFVRIPEGMKPTEHALRIAPSVREGLRLLLSAALDGKTPFDPQTDERTFQMLLSDIGEVAYLPSLMRRLGEVAPLLGIRVLNLPREAYPSSFFSGEADVAIGVLPGLGAGFYQQRLFTNNYVCLVRVDHPRIRRRVTLAQLVAESHVVIEPGGSRYQSATHQTSTSTLIEQFLAERGVKRRVALHVPHFIVVPDVIRSSDLISVMPSHLVRQAHGHRGVKVLPLPFDVPQFDVNLFWHERKHQDPGNCWLRGEIVKLFRMD